METTGLTGWLARARFVPSRDDFIYASESKYISPERRCELIVTWRSVAETQAINAILIMMYHRTGG